MEITNELILQVINEIDKSIGMLDKTNHAYNYVRLYILKNHKKEIGELLLYRIEIRFGSNLMRNFGYGNMRDSHDVYLFNRYSDAVIDLIEEVYVNIHKKIHRDSCDAYITNYFANIYPTLLIDPTLVTDEEVDKIRNRIRRLNDEM